MPETLPDQWARRDYPVLRAVVEFMEPAPHRPASPEQVAAATGLSLADVRSAADALAADDYLSIMVSSSFVYHFWSITPKARRETGVWPTPEAAADRLIAALEREVERTDDPEHKSRLKAALAGLTDAGKQVAIAVATSVLTGQVS